MSLFNRYLDWLARANGLAPGPVEWLFYTGMLQDSPDMWWADFGRRHAPHEGIDLCFYRRGSDRDRISALAPGALVPAMAQGTLLNISEDLLGLTLAVSLGPAVPGQSDPQGPCRQDGAVPVLVYSHTAPDPDLKPGDRIVPGRIIAGTFDARIRNSRLRSHLHISCVLVPRDTPWNALDWHLFPDRNTVSYINPVFL